MHPLLSVAAALLYFAEPSSPARPPVTDAAKGAQAVQAAAPAPAPAPAPAAAAPVEPKAAPETPPATAPSPGAAKVEPAAAATSPASSAPAAPAVAVAVVPLDAPNDLALLGRSLAEAVAQEAAKLPGVQGIAPSAVLAKLGAAAAQQASRCGEAAACLVGAGKQLAADRVVGGWIDRVGASYKFGLVLVDVKTGVALARVDREVPIASRRIRADVVAAAGPLLRGEAAVTGVLVLRTELPGAEVRVDDKPAGKTPLEARLPAGKHKVEVSQRGKVRVEPFWVDVPVNGRVEQRVRLFDIPLAERRPGVVETTTVEMGKPTRKK